MYKPKLKKSHNNILNYFILSLLCDFLRGVLQNLKNKIVINTLLYDFS